MFTVTDYSCLTDDAVADRWQACGSIVSEDACLELIDGLFPSQAGHNPLGRGDDCALLTCPPHMALSTDTFFEDSHFRTTYFTPAEAGAKALVSSVSDLAAAGAIPLGFSLGLMLPPKLGRNVLAELLGGMAQAAGHYGILLTGGDIAKAPKLGLCVTVWGKSAIADSPFFLRRGQASPGDYLFSIGTLGLARAGLALLELHGRSALKKFPQPCGHHLCPAARIADGITLARLAHNHLAHTCLTRNTALIGAPPDEDAIPLIGLMDVSDGLARDIPRLLGGKKGPASLGAALSFPEKAVSPALRAAASHLKCPPHQLMLSGGEDYTLLGSCPPQYWHSLEQALPSVCHIGEVTSGNGLFYEGAPLETGGFDHFER